MQLSFVKMQGAGNDVIIVDGTLQSLPSDFTQLAPVLCDRHFGIGADQIIVLSESKDQKPIMQTFNADGSEVEMCGNGLRCLARYLFDRSNQKTTHFEIQTPAGLLKPQMIPSPKDSHQWWVKVDMGEPILSAERIPTRGKGTLISHRLDLMQPVQSIEHVFMTCVSMGNPHAIIYVDRLEDYPVEAVGSQIENHPFFPNRTNIEFVQVLNPGHVKQRTWERGAGETLACGTGASAVCVAGVLNQLTLHQLQVDLPGGVLLIEWDASSNHVYMSGPAQIVFEGVYHV